MNAKTQELLNVLQNEEAMNAFGQAKSVEEALEILKANGLEMTAEELRVAKANLSSAPKEGELGEEDLETVSGGVNWYKIGQGIMLILEGIFS